MKNETAIQIPALTIRAEVRADSVDKDARTVELVFSTGAPVLRYDWMSGQRYLETLSLNPKHVRLDRLNNSAPFLNAHNSYSLEAVIGVVEPGTARIEGGKGLAKVRFSKRDDVEPIWRDVQDGIVRNVSVGYRVHKYEQTEGKDGAAPTRHAVDWEPFEISAVPMGADDGAKMRAVQPTEMNPCVIVTRVAEDTMLKDDKREEQPAATTAAPTTAAPPAADKPDSAEARAAGVQGERDRVLGIQKAVRAAKLDEALADELITKGTTLDQARALVLEKLAARDAEKPTDQRVAIVNGQDEFEKWQCGAAAWLFQKAAVADMIERAAKKQPANAAFKDISLDPGEFRGLSLIDLARESLERRGVRTRGMDKMRIAGFAFTHRAGAGYQSTSDFATALENVMHKTLLAAFVIAPDTWRRFCAIGSVSDFRSHPRYRTGYLNRLSKIGEHGEFTNTAIPDASKEAIQASTFGNIIGLTRQTIINDDMGVFNRVAVQIGRATGLSIELEVYDLIKLNAGLGPAMNDTKTLFHADHGNIGTGAALSVASVDADRVLMAQQKDPNGKEFLDIRPAVLVLPVGLGGAARVLNEAQFDVDAVGGGSNANKFMKPNVVVGLFRDIVDTPQLTGTRRYMFADPAVMPTIEVAFLEGQQQPFLEMQEGWRIDGVEWKVRHDFGVAGVEVRGALTNAGA